MTLFLIVVALFILFGILPAIAECVGADAFEEHTGRDMSTRH